MRHFRTLCFAALGLVLGIAGTAEQAHSAYSQTIRNSQATEAHIRHVINNYIELKQTVDNYRQYEVNTYGINGRFSWEIARQIMVQNGWLSERVTKGALRNFARSHGLTEGIEKLDPLRTEEQKLALHCKLLDIYEEENCRTLGEAIAIASERLEVKENTLREIRYRFNDIRLPQRRPQASMRQPAPQGSISAEPSFVLPQAQGAVQSSATTPQLPLFTPVSSTGTYYNHFPEAPNQAQNDFEEPPYNDYYYDGFF